MVVKAVTRKRERSRKKLKVYLIGSLRNLKLPKIAQKIRELGFEVFDDWYAAGRKADDE